MSHRQRALRNVVFAVGFALALGFGVNEALAYTPCTTCTQPPPTACGGYPDPDLFCANLCINFYDCENGGECDRFDECTCFE